MITGTAGLIGSHLAETLVKQGTPILATYLNPTVDVRTIDPAVKLIPLDVCDRAAVFSFIEAHRPTVIYHLAAQSLPTVSWTDPWLTMHINLDGTINVFEAIKEIRHTDTDYDPMVVIACSSAEYGSSLVPERVPIREDAPLLPLHPYGVSKVGQDLLGHQYFVNHGLRCIRARIFNCTGPRKRNDVVSDFGRAVVGAVRQGTIIRHGTLVTKRAIIDVRDMVSALMALAERGKAGEVYNICADAAYQIGEILDLYFEIAGKPYPAEVDPALLRPSDEAIIFGDTTKIRSETGWRPMITLRQTLQDVYAFENGQAAMRVQ